MKFLTSDPELYRKFAGNPAFKQWLTEMVFREIYDPTAGDNGNPDGPPSSSAENDDQG